MEYPKKIFSGKMAVKRLVSIIILLGCITRLSAQKVFTLHADSLKKNIELSFIYADWYFHSGDLQQPVVSTQGWDTLQNTSFGKSDHPRNWKGMGWFGLWVKVDEKAVNKKLCLRINHDGASEIFVDGRPVGGFGKVGFSAKEMQGVSYAKELIPLWFGDTLPHLIAVRYSNFIGVYPDFYGFQIFIGDYNLMRPLINRSVNLRSFLPMNAAAQFILALLHLLLFFFYPKQKLNLYFAAFAIVLGVISETAYLFYETHSPVVQYYAKFISGECLALLLWFGGLLLYSVGYGHIPKWKLITLAAVSSIYFMEHLVNAVWYNAWHYNDYFSFVFVVVFCDAFWGVFKAARKGRPGIRLIGVAMIVVALVCFFTWMDILHIWATRQDALRLFTLSMGELIFPVCISLYLALDFARTNQNLSDKLKEVKTLSAHALAQEAEKRALIANEARHLEETVRERTAEIQRQTDKLKEMDVVKSRFFTNITHEFKTPLTLISNPAQELLAKNEDVSVQYHAGLIKKNAERLLQLINQLLDLSKLESGLMNVTQSPVELISELKKYIGNYEPLAKQKGIELVFTSDWEELWILSDHDKLEKISSNLLSNALKFTDKGTVKTALEKRDDITFTLSVRDTGKGIAPFKLPYIFERFYQADPSDIRSAEGTGIGLALAKELAELMGGDIRAESVEDQYTLMEVTLPLLPALPQQQDEIAAMPSAIQLQPDISVLFNGTEKLPVADNDSNLILVIEDNDELREFICRSLANRFRVIHAPDGKAGTALAQEHIPNVIITDIMMPEMDGYEVCSVLKSDERTSHIPVIMLTAKSGTESRIQGIETGADAYLGKPFVQKELFAVMENLMKTRRLLQEKYSKNNMIFTKADELPSIEKQFLDRVQSAVQNHLDNELFGADQLAAEIGLSRTQLHRKLKALLGKSPGDFIRTIRMEHAYHLLKERIATVSGVAYMVGFSNPASFSASFSRHFGFPPSEVVGKKA
ncbi:MAG TPA: ATP-binding protein [Chitinophagaceae bacterium]|nr:ATP-binding protein [Chitinophagaceae bacterium]